MGLDNAACIEPFIHLHNGHAILFITLEQGRLNRTRARQRGNKDA